MIPGRRLSWRSGWGVAMPERGVSVPIWSVPSSSAVADLFGWSIPEVEDMIVHQLW